MFSGSVFGFASRGAHTFGSFPCRVDYTVSAPRNCALKVNGVSNDASAEGFEGEADFHSVSGEITLKNMKGPIKISTVSGKLELNKPIVRQVVVHGANHIVAIRIGIRIPPLLLKRISLCVAIPRHIEPVPSPPFAITRGSEQAIDQPFIGQRRLVVSWRRSDLDVCPA